MRNQILREERRRRFQRAEIKIFRALNRFNLFHQIINNDIRAQVKKFKLIGGKIKGEVYGGQIIKRLSTKYCRFITEEDNWGGQRK
jgi:hypothetical protein